MASPYRTGGGGPGRASCLRVAAIVMALLAVALAAPGGARAAPESARPLRVATLEWAPWVGPELPRQGVTAEIVRTAFARAGHSVELRFLPWTRVLKETRAGVFAAAFPAYHDAGRERDYVFSRPIAVGPLVLYQRSGLGVRYGRVEDLAPYRIGVVRGYVNTPALDTARGLTKELAATDVSNLRKLLRGRVDLAVVDALTGAYLLEHEIGAPPGSVERVEPPLAHLPLHVIFPRARPDHAQMRQAFDQALAAMQRDGTLAELLGARGFAETLPPADVEPATPPAAAPTDGAP